ncbi:transcriptional regulator ATRX homolog [Microcaecilia unicolor]|uniref:Transcriptional regulator ATRX homolog n=1 Tax=Microcaecilia unicolor TaxID=1415580 RepID=A0A6P7ZI55_9AMPH|nr:transcriptional regulator ATRX homolog [Microcaecilia unicolor]XP_030074841.1 transcriptional regulator ATRX homolog [Microcaecilia unicolor]
MKGKQIQEEESIGEPGVLQEAKPKKRGRKKKSQMDPSDVASLPAEPEPVTKDGQEDLEVKPKRKNKSSLVPKENGSNEDNGTAEGANTKKRGRKKKEMVSGDALPVGTIDVNQAEKPKRGRKKKMETAVTDQVKENDASADLKKDQKRGRTKKNKPNAEDEGKEPMALEAP